MKFDKSDIDKLVLVPVDLSKLSDVVKNDVVRKDVYDKLVAKVNNIDTSGFVLKTEYDTDKSKLENKIPDYNTKITEIEGKIPDISNLATKTALTTGENKIPDVSNLATKNALNTVENKIPVISNLATKTPLNTVENKMPDVNSLVKKTDYNTRDAEIDTKLSSLDGRIVENKSIRKNILLLFWGNMMFDSEDGSQAYLIFQPVHRYFKRVTNTNYISSW